MPLIYANNKKNSNNDYVIAIAKMVNNTDIRSVLKEMGSCKALCKPMICEAPPAKLTGYSVPTVLNSFIIVKNQC